MISSFAGKIRFSALILFVLVSCAAMSWAVECAELSEGQTVYVPVYSHVYYGNKPRAMNLTTTLSIRNTDREETISILSVDYHDSDGKLIRAYVSSTVALGPLASTHFIVKESDVSGGDTPCFIIKWKSTKKVSPPAMEGVMIGAASGQGISFTLPGRVLSDQGS